MTPPILFCPKEKKKTKQNSPMYDKPIISIIFILLWSVLMQTTFNSIGLFALWSTIWKKQWYENTFEV